MADSTTIEDVATSGLKHSKSKRWSFMLMGRLVQETGEVVIFFGFGLKASKKVVMVVLTTTPSGNLAGPARLGAYSSVGGRGAHIGDDF